MLKDIIGRKKEIARFQRFIESGKSEFIAIYGRRRIGKTYLVRKILENHFSFFVTGIDNVTMSEQLLNFTLELRKYSGNNDIPVPDNWLTAFDLLIRYLEKLPKGKKILFIDEIPWMDTPRSSFISGLEHFWNAWASGRNDIKLIVCGSATSWMLNKLINNRGGLHNRLTQKMLLMPFTLCECEEYFKAKGFGYARKEIAECYMVMGGVPYYLTLLDKEMSLAQNIDRLFFEIGCSLDGEFDKLFRALFKYSESYIKIVEALATKAKGLTRQEIISITGLTNNGGLTSMLNELETCGFISRYEPIDKIKKQSLYQLVDFYTLFYFHFINKNNYRDEHFWTNSLASTLHRAWSGYAFEMLCMVHDSQIKTALGISGIQSKMASWRSTQSSKGAQIDLLIDRSDMTINICEIKYSSKPFVITKKYKDDLQNKIDDFVDETKTRKSIMLTMITTYGIEHNEHSGHVQKEITLEDLFAR